MCPAAAVTVTHMLYMQNNVSSVQKQTATHGTGSHVERQIHQTQNRNGNTRRYHYDKKKTEVTKESEYHDEQWRGPQKTEEENLEVLQWQADREE